MTSTMVRRKAGTDLTSGPIVKTLILFSAPIVLSNVIQQLYSIVDLLVVGQYVGSVGTVGVSTGGEIADYMIALAMALAATAQVFIAQYVGARDFEKVRKMIGTVLTLFGIMAFIVLAAIIILNDNILTWLQCPQEAYQQAKAYMIVTAIGMPFIFGYNAICGILRGMGESRKPLQFVVISAIINIFLDLILVMVFELQAFGTAVATVVSQIGAFAASAIYMYKQRAAIHFEFRLGSFRIDKSLAKKFILLAIPQFVRIGMVRFSMMWVNANINGYGLIPASTNNIGSKIQKFMEILIFGAETGASSMVGQNLGAHKTKRARNSVLAAFGYALAIAIVSTAIFLLIPKPLYSIFTSEQPVIELGVTYLQIMIVMIFLNAVTGPFQAMVTGCGHVSLGFVIGIMDGLSRIGFSLLFVKVFNLGVFGYFWGSAFTRSINCIIVTVFFFSNRWKKRKLLTE